MAFNSRISGGGSGGVGGGAGSSSVPTLFVLGDTLGNHVTSSTSYVDIDAAYSVDIPAVAGDVLEMIFECEITHSTSQTTVFTFNVGASGDLDPETGVAGTGEQVCCVHYHTVQGGDVSGGTVTVTARFRTDSGTATVLNTSTFNRGPKFSAKNLGQ